VDTKGACATSSSVSERIATTALVKKPATARDGQAAKDWSQSFSYRE
jgi:hypothetical protein